MTQDVYFFLLNSDLNVQERSALTCVSKCNLDTGASYIWYKNGQEIKNANSDSYSGNPYRGYGYGHSYSCAIRGYQQLVSPPLCELSTPAALFRSTQLLANAKSAFSIFQVCPAAPGVTGCFTMREASALSKAQQWTLVALTAPTTVLRSHQNSGSQKTILGTSAWTTATRLLVSSLKNQKDNRL